MAAGSLKERVKPGAEKEGRLDTDLGLVAAIVAWPMWLSGILLIILAVFTFVLAFLVGDRVDPTGVSVRLTLLITAVVTVLIGMLYVFLSRSVRRQARWAYVIAILGYGVPAFAALMGVLPVPAEVGLPDWYVTLETVLQWVYIVLALMAVMLLAASFMSRDDAPASVRDPS